jgi:hypothetical protein
MKETPKPVYRVYTEADAMGDRADMAGMVACLLMMGAILYAILVLTP